ncbi:MAG: succinylglutamate desuccinylase/aspartoacylase family protein [Geminicoccaceae bacterium]
MQTAAIDLPAAAPGTARQLVVHRFGAPGARPKAYLQAALHADELPGALVLNRLLPLLAQAERAGRVRGEIVVVPMANPIGLAQSVMQTHLGRYDLAWLSNFNRGWPDLVEPVAAAVGRHLGPDPRTNVAVIRAALGEAVARLPAHSENAALRRHLLAQAIDADLVLDLHCDLEAVLHLYLGTPLWPDAADLAADVGAEAVLLAEASGGNPFDEAFSAIWWQLARRFPDRPIPNACLATTLEYRGLRDVDADLAGDDAMRLLRFLMRRGVVAGDPGPLPPPRCDATPLDGAAMIEAPATGMLLFDVAPGDEVTAGARVARLLDPRDASGTVLPVVTPVAGRVFARCLRGFARAGEVVVKVAGLEPIAGRSGLLLPN